MRKIRKQGKTSLIAGEGKEEWNMQNRLPRDPVMLLGVVNTKLRDFYGSLDEMCEDMQISRAELESDLKTIDYEYDAGRNQFV